MQSTLGRRTTLLVALSVLMLSACPAFGEEDPGADLQLCDLDPDSCLPDDSAGGTGLSAGYEPPPDPGQGQEQEVDPPPGYEPQPDPGDLYEPPPDPGDAYGP